MTAETRRAAFRRDGFVRVEQVCAAELPACRHRVDEILASDDPSAIRRFGRDGAMIHCKIPQLAERDADFRRLAQDDRLVSIVEELIGPARIFRDVVIAKPPRGGAVVHYHQDAAYWDLDRPDLVLSAWIAMDDASEEAGCLQVLPGSHGAPLPHGLSVAGRQVPEWAANALRRATSLTGTGDNPRTVREKAFARAKKVVLGTATRFVPSFNDLNDLRIAPRLVPADRLVSLPARSGDVVFFSSRLVHGSGPNTSKNPRRAYIVSYMGEECRALGRHASDFLPARPAAPAPA